MPKESFQSFNILIVEDVAVHRQLMQDGLRRINPFLHFGTAGNVTEAKHLLSGNHHFHAVICDRSMPGGEGYELLEWMRGLACFNRVPFIMISGHTQPEEIIEAFTKFRVDSYVTKPFSHNDLYEKLIKALTDKNPVLIKSSVFRNPEPH